MRKQDGLPARRQAGKLLVPLLTVLAVLSMGVAAFAIVLQMQEREKRQAKERELMLVLAEKNDLQDQLADLQETKSRVEEQLGQTRKELEATREKLAETVDANQALSRSVEDRQKEIDRLSKDLDQTQAERKQLASQVQELERERETVEERIEELEQAKADLETKVTELSQGPTVELDKVLVTNPAAAVDSVPGQAVGAASPKAGEGQVVVINREYDFIVMNLGKNHGLSVGQEFQIVRGDEVLGRVKVEKVYDELSAAAILPESQEDHIREGDTVRAL